MIFLTATEVAEMTGKVRHQAQVKVLQQMRVPFLCNAAGRPIVARAAVERILGAQLEDVPQQTPSRANSWQSVHSERGK